MSSANREGGKRFRFLSVKGKGRTTYVHRGKEEIGGKEKNMIISTNGGRPIPPSRGGRKRRKKGLLSTQKRRGRKKKGTRKGRAPND